VLLNALSYVARGWRVFPCHSIRPEGGCTCGKDHPKPGKHPRTRHGCTEATTDSEVIRSWWERWPDSNVGIATGPESNLAVVDIDPRHAGDETFRGLELKYAAVPDTIEVKTGSPGRHIYFLYPAGRRWKSAEATLGVGVDTKGIGGYVIAPPSLHESGRAYEWDAACHPDETPLVAPPEWLLDLVDPQPGVTASVPAVPGIEDGAADELAPKLLRWAIRRVDRGRSRNRTGFDLAVQARDNGFTRDGARALLAELVARCGNAGDHPYTLAEAEASLGQAFGRPARAPWVRTAAAPSSPAAPSSEPEDPSIGHRLTDLGNAERFARQHRDDIRYAYLWESWLTWDGTRWALDQTDESIRRAKDTVRAIYGEAQGAPSELARRAVSAHAAKSESAGRIDAMLRLARAEPGIGILPERLDANPWVLNVANGVLDLRSSSLGPHERTALCAKLVPVEYDPGASCPLWEAFLDRIMAGRADLIGFLQRAAGYSLTGSTREQCLFVLHGLGANGKSTFLDTLRLLLGDYAEQTDPKTFQEKKGDSISNDIARLKGARLVAASETESGGRLAESLVKQMTGGEPLTARFLHKEFFTFRPEFKVFLATNHKPVIRGTDNAIWRRIRLVPFDVTIPPAERDKDLLEKLRAELPGILAWAVRGCAAWLSGGLAEPESVTGATSDYRDEMDVLGPFFNEECHFDRRAETSAAELYAAYARWCDRSHEEPMRQRSFGMSLTERGLTRHKDGRGLYRWRGVGLGKQPVHVGTDDTDQSDRVLGFSSRFFSRADNLVSRSESSVSSVLCPDCGGAEFRASGSGKALCVKCWGAA